MATCIFYEFLLANKYPRDKRFCHNALVLAPDKTVLDSLKEIFTFDKSKVVPKKEAIRNNFLKNVEFNGYENIKEYEFIKSVLKDFMSIHSNKRYEGMLPKIAFYAATVKELEDELKPLVEKVLYELNIPLNKILVNVGDIKLTKNEDIKEFQSLDTPNSEKQIILLVNKGKEGWNCRSLFSVALYRKPKSAVFVLQATMRCLRSIGKVQETGKIYLSKENIQILEDELNKNYRVGMGDIKKINKENIQKEVRIIPPPKKVKIKKIVHHHSFEEKKEIVDIVDFGLSEIDYSKYEINLSIYKGIELESEGTEIITSEQRSKRKYSKIMLINEISNYLNLSCLLIEKLLKNSKDTLPYLNLSCLLIEKLLKNSKDTLPIILNYVNKYNEIIYDIIIPKLFNIFYEIKVTQEEIEEEVLLVREPKDGVYKFSTKEELFINKDDLRVREFNDKSFNVDTYCFDSRKEKEYFMRNLCKNEVKKIFFTGMFTQGQSDFYIQYVDPETFTLRKYYPDFFLEKEDGKTYIVEIKGEHMIDSEVVKE